MIRIVVLALLSGITVRGEDSVPKLNLNQSIAYYNNCSFSAKNFSSSCILQSCPNLSQKCPNSPTGCSAVSSLLSQCLQRPEAVICGVRVAHTPICPLRVELFGITKLVTGSCLIKPDTGFIDGLQNATFCVSPSAVGPLTVTLSAPYVTSYASYDCSFVLFNNTITAPDVDVRLTLAINATATLDLSVRPAAVSTKVDRSDISFASADFNGLPQNIVDALTDAVTDEFRAAGTDLAAAHFLATYAASALRAADPSCFKQ